MTPSMQRARAVSALHRRGALMTLAVGLVLSLPARGQDDGNASAAEERALDALLAGLPPDLSESELKVLSGMLADASARADWIARHVKRSEPEPRPPPTRALVDLTADELEVLVERAWPSREKTAFAALSDEDRRLLWARGVPAALLDLPDTLPPDRVLTGGQWKWWHAPAVIAGELLSREAGDLPDLATLIRLDQRLRRVESVARKQLGERFDEHFAFGDFQIARALLDRALGVDDKDFGDGRPVSAPQSWPNLCARLAQERTWRWELLGRLLSSPPSSEADALSALLGGLEKVLPEDAPGRWPTCRSLVQRVRQQQLLTAGGLALQADVREHQRRRRTEEERAFLEAWQAGDNDRILRGMQRAKAAGLGLDAERIVPALGSLSDAGTLQGLLRDPLARTGQSNPGVHLYVELLRVEGTCYALLLRADQPVLTKAETRFGVDRASHPTVNGVLSAAMDRLFGGTSAFNARVIVALDVVDPKQLLDARGTLLRCVQKVEKGETHGWFLAVPSAAALLEHSPWNEESVLRFAYLLAARIPENPTPLWRTAGARQEISSVPAPIGRRGKALLLAVSPNPAAQPASGPDLHQVCGRVKEDERVPLTLPIFVPEPRP